MLSNRFLHVAVLVSALGSTAGLGRCQMLLPGGLAGGAAAGNQQSPAIARGNDQFLAVWSDGRADLTNVPPLGSRDVYAARLAADGSVIDAIPILVSQAGGSQTKPRVAWNGTAWLVVWITQVPTASFWTTRVDAIGSLLPIVLQGGGAGNGWQTLSATIAAGMTGTVTLQVGFADPGAPGGLSTSNALLLNIQ